MGESYERYSFLYYANEGERIKFQSFNLIARRYINRLVIMFMKGF